MVGYDSDYDMNSIIITFETGGQKALFEDFLDETDGWFNI